jgi:hypothetical protein
MFHIRSLTDVMVARASDICTVMVHRHGPNLTVHIPKPCTGGPVLMHLSQRYGSSYSCPESCRFQSTRITPMKSIRDTIRQSYPFEETIRL